MQILQDIKKYKNIITSVFVALLIIVFLYSGGDAKTISKDKFDSFIKNDEIKSAYIKGEYLYLNAENEEYKILRDFIFINKLNKKVQVEIKSDANYNIWDIFVIITLLIVLYLTYKISIKGNSKEFSLSSNSETKEKFRPMKSNITFDNIAGIDSVKKDVFEVVDFIKNNHKYRDFNIKVPRGVLLVGPPGVGKTLIAKAIANEAKLPFYYENGASFVRIYVGMGAKRVKELFNEARRNAPSIIFIDEIDAVGKRRGSSRNDERDSTLNQLLTEIDGFEESSGVMVIAATNRIEVLDEALLRAGRFDRRIFIDLPNLKDREDILNLYLKDKSYDFDIKEVARNSATFASSTLSLLINEAAIHAFKRGSKSIGMVDVLAVRDKIVDGFKRKSVFDENDKESIALYKSAKILLASKLDIEFESISFVSDNFVNRETDISSKNRIVNDIRVDLIGKTILDLYEKDMHTNLIEDINRARKNIEFLISSGLISKGIFEEDGMRDKFYEEMYTKNIEFIKNNSKLLEMVKDMFLKKEILTKDDMRKILNKNEIL